MINYPKRKAFYEGYIVHTKRLAIAFILLGLVGIFFPVLLGMTTAVFTGWVAFFLGLSAAYYTYKVDRSSVFGWIKSLLLIIAGLLMVFNPWAGAVALALLLAAYLFVDAAINFSLAFTLKPAIHKIWPVLNGIVSTILGVLLIMFAPDPLKESWILGIYVGISLLFDGLMLWQLSKGADKIVVEELYVEE